MKAEKEAENLSWQKFQDELAKQYGLAVVVVEGEDSAEVSVSNNNSICQTLATSKELSERCKAFCGQAFRQVKGVQKRVNVKCHAGLNYLAVPLESENHVAIVGRTFLKTQDFKEATKQTEKGDWKTLPTENLFENVIISASEKNLENLAHRFENLSEDELQSLLWNREEKLAESSVNVSQKEQNVSASKVAKKTLESQEISAWRSLFGSLNGLSYREAIVVSLQFLAKKHQLQGLAWLERKLNHLEMTFAGGNLKGSEMQFKISADDPRLQEIIKQETSLELKERQETPSKKEESQIIQLFSITDANEVRSAVITDKKLSEKEKRQIARFCRKLSPSLEVLRLREQLEKQSWLANAVQKFNESLKKVDSEDFWIYLAQTSAELMRAERGSLLVFDEEEQNLVVKAAIGNRAEFLRNSQEKIGERIAETVWSSGRPLVVSDIQQAGFSPAPLERKYKSKSFISYPISLGSRKVGILNVTDKADGGVYDEFDLELLETIAPQLAMAIDRASFKTKAGEFEQLSITDGLTGLMNRRYLEARLIEELKRSQRHGYPLSFFMIDVDEFKSYNDKFLHTEGDKALQILGQALKATLRDEDIAARYGGEEFSILLPQTTLFEAQQIAERIRQKIEQTRFPNRQITISIGVAACSNVLNTATALKSAADAALYEAKMNGRNCVRIYQNKPETVQVK